MRISQTAAFVDATDSRYGFCSKDLRRLGGSELSRMHELMSNDHGECPNAISICKVILFTSLSLISIIEFLFRLELQNSFQRRICRHRISTPRKPRRLPTSLGCRPARVREFRNPLHQWREFARFGKRQKAEAGARRRVRERNDLSQFRHSPGRRRVHRPGG